MVVFPPPATAILQCHQKNMKHLVGEKRVFDQFAYSPPSPNFKANRSRRFRPKQTKHLIRSEREIKIEETDPVHPLVHDLTDYGSTVHEEAEQRILISVRLFCLDF